MFGWMFGCRRDQRIEGERCECYIAALVVTASAYEKQSSDDDKGGKDSRQTDG